MKTILKHSAFLFSFFASFSPITAAALKSQAPKSSAPPTQEIPLENLFMHGDRCARELSTQNKPVILVMGPTRAGKSTLICELLGVAWEAQIERRQVEEEITITI